MNSTPTTNQGVQTPEKMEPSSTNPNLPSSRVITTLDVDWLSVHIPHDFQFYLMDMWQGEWIKTAPRWGYRRAWQHPETGAIVMATQQHTDAEPILVMSGSACGAVADMRGLTDTFELVKWLYPMVTDATRVDIALDVHDGGVSGDRVNLLAQEGKVSSRSTKVVTFQSNGDFSNVTTYFGARTSPRFLRVYTKQSKLQADHTFTRIEQELKKSAANEAFALLAAASRDEVQGIVVSLLRRIVTYWGVDYLDQIGTQAFEIQPPRRDDATMERREWLARQVVPSLKRDYKAVGWKASLIRWLLRETRG